MCFMIEWREEPFFSFNSWIAFVTTAAYVGAFNFLTMLGFLFFPAVTFFAFTEGAFAVAAGAVTSAIVVQVDRCVARFLVEIFVP